MGSDAQIEEAPALVDPWTERMRAGDFAGAWEISDRVLRSRAGQPCWHWPRHLQYVWDGRSVVGRRVLVRCYHGLGDTLQFVRFAPQLRALASRVVLWVQPALIELLRGVEGIDELVPLTEGTPEVDFDVDLELMEIPHLLRTTLDTLPARVPYLYPAAAAGPAVPVKSDERLARENSGKGHVLAPETPALKVGVVWLSGDWDERRSLPIECVAGFSKVPGVELHSLQRGQARADWSPEYGYDSGSDDPLAAARTMQAMDLVVSVDSMPAHLAGALGLPTWTLLQRHADWRWLADRDDSPWYPTMTLYRQAVSGEWSAVAERVAADLRSLVAARRACRS